MPDEDGLVQGRPPFESLERVKDFFTTALSFVKGSSLDDKDVSFNVGEDQNGNRVLKASYGRVHVVATLLDEEQEIAEALAARDRDKTPPTKVEELAEDLFDRLMLILQNSLGVIVQHAVTFRVGKLDLLEDGFAGYVEIGFKGIRVRQDYTSDEEPLVLQLLIAAGDGELRFDEDLTFNLSADA